MQQWWTNFAKTGDPICGGLPKWPTYNAASECQVIHLDAQSAASNDITRERDVVLDSIWGK